MMDFFFHHVLNLIFNASEYSLNFCQVPYATSLNTTKIAINLKKKNRNLDKDECGILLASCMQSFIVGIPQYPYAYKSKNSLKNIGYLKKNCPGECCLIAAYKVISS